MKWIARLLVIGGSLVLGSVIGIFSVVNMVYPNLPTMVSDTMTIVTCAASVASIFVGLSMMDSFDD
jgi:hypothetical protein